MLQASYQTVGAHARDVPRRLVGQLVGQLLVIALRASWFQDPGRCLPFLRVCRHHFHPEARAKGFKVSQNGCAQHQARDKNHPLVTPIPTSKKTSTPELNTQDLHTSDLCCPPVASGSRSRSFMSRSQHTSKKPAHSLSFASPDWLPGPSASDAWRWLKMREAQELTAAASSGKH